MARLNYKRVSLCLLGVILLLLGAISRLAVQQQYLNQSPAVTDANATPPKLAAEGSLIPTTPNLRASASVAVEVPGKDCFYLEESVPWTAPGTVLGSYIGDVSLIALGGGPVYLDGVAITNAPAPAIAFKSSAVPTSPNTVSWIVVSLNGMFLKMVEVQLTRDELAEQVRVYASAAGYVEAASFGIIDSSAIIPGIVETAWKYRVPLNDASSYRVTGLSYCICRVINTRLTADTPIALASTAPTVDRVIITSMRSRLGGPYVTNGPITAHAFRHTPSETGSNYAVSSGYTLNEGAWILAAVDGDFLKMARVIVLMSSSNKPMIKFETSGYVHRDSVGHVTTSTLTEALVSKAWPNHIHSEYAVESVSYYTRESSP